MARARRLSNITKKLVKELIQNNIASALTAVAGDTPDTVAIQPPPSNSYFEYGGIKGYQLPAIFTIIEDFNFKLDKGTNHINAEVYLNVAVLLEDKDAARLVTKADYYLDALLDILQNAHVDDVGEKVRIIVKVERAKFSPEYVKDAGQGQQLFRKEVHFECMVEHYTN